jgi:hypothetical protein
MNYKNDLIRKKTPKNRILIFSKLKPQVILYWIELNLKIHLRLKLKLMNKLKKMILLKKKIHQKLNVKNFFLF